MMKTHDSLGRRMRGGNPRSTGKLVRLQQLDADLLYPILLHGPLSSKEITAFSGRPLQQVLARLKVFFHETNNGYDNRLIHVPKAHLGDDLITAKAHVYDLTPTGRTFLMDMGYFHENTPKVEGNMWRHDRMGSQITAWLDLGMREQFDLYEPIYHHELFNEIGGSFKIYDKTITPDRFFGTRFLETGKRRVYIIEADRGNEDLATKKGRATIQGKLLKYEQWFKSMQFKKDIPNAGVAVLFVTVSPGRMNGMMKLADKTLTSDIARKAILFNWMPGYKPIYKPYPPEREFFYTPWPRAGLEPFVMS